MAGAYNNNSTTELVSVDGMNGLQHNMCAYCLGTEQACLARAPYALAPLQHFAHKSSPMSLSSCQSIAGTIIRASDQLQTVQVHPQVTALYVLFFEHRPSSRMP